MSFQLVLHENGVKEGVCVCVRRTDSGKIKGKIKVDVNKKKIASPFLMMPKEICNI